MILYGRINSEGYINGFSDRQCDEFDTPFEIADELETELSACSGNCFKVEKGVAVKVKDVKQYVNLWRQRQADKLKADLLKRELAKTDYKAIKYAEGLISGDEYLPVKKERADLREMINFLEEE